jgi:anti-sigma B factor antagonist
MEEEFEVAEHDGDIPVLAVRGEIDVSTAPELRDRLVQINQRGTTTVVVDLSEVSFLDSTALGVLVSGLKRFRSAGGDLRLVVTGRSVSKVLEITGLHEVFKIYETAEAAVSA